MSIPSERNSDVTGVLGVRPPRIPGYRAQLNDIKSAQTNQNPVIQAIQAKLDIKPTRSLFPPLSMFNRVVKEKVLITIINMI